jgi:threonine dehydrogenase-like Zn-dependent dehydrogenase
MKALIFDGQLAFDSDARAPLPNGEALVRVRTAGICNTDLEITRGYMQFRGILGHEFIGEVVDAPDRSWVGRRVCGEINARCGHCRWCARGMSTHCEHRTVLGILGRSGAFAEYLTLPIANLHPVPENIPDEAAVFVEPLAAAYEILEQISVAAYDQVIVLGDGKLGLLCVQVLRGAGARVVLAGKHEAKLSLARNLGIDAMHVDDAAASTGVDVVVEATGSPAGFARALGLIRPRGIIVLKSTVANPLTIDMSRVVVNEITLVGSRCGPFSRAIAALAAGRIQVQPLISDRFPLQRGVDAFERAASPGVLKVLVEIS